MRRLVVGGLAGIALVFTGSLLVIERLTRDGPTAPRPRVEEAPSAEAPPPAPEPALPPPPGLQDAMNLQRGIVPGGAASLPVIRDPPKPRPPPDSWEAVPVLARTSRGKDRDPVTGAVVKELNDFHDQLAACFDPAVAARSGGRAPVRTQDEVAGEGDSIVFVLQLELSPGSVRIVEAPAASLGGSGEETVACAQALLRGKVLDTPTNRASGRRRMNYSLIP